MFELSVDNDGGINLGKEANLWRATVTFHQQPVFTTGFNYPSPQAAMGGAATLVVQALQYALHASQAGQLYDQEAQV